MLHVVNPGVDVYVSEAYRDMRYERIIEELKQSGVEVVVSAREIAEEYDTTVETEIETGQPARTIVAYAEEHPMDQIIMGSRGRSGLKHVLLGSVAETVVRRSPVPVTIVR